MYHASFTRTFAAAHRVWNDDGKCHNIHGHNYRCEIDISSNDLDGSNFVVPFDEIKRVIDFLDHTLIVHDRDPILSKLIGLGVLVTEVDGVPSTEFMAQWIADRIAVLRPGLSVSVLLRETDSIEAMAGASS